MDNILYIIELLYCMIYIFQNEKIKERKTYNFVASAFWRIYPIKKKENLIPITYLSKSNL